MGNPNQLNQEPTKERFLLRHPKLTGLLAAGALALTACGNNVEAQQPAEREEPPAVAEGMHDEDYEEIPDIAEGMGDDDEIVVDAEQAEASGEAHAEILSNLALTPEQFNNMSEEELREFFTLERLEEGQTKEEVVTAFFDRLDVLYTHLKLTKTEGHTIV
jgi:hypothetical protein